MPKLNAIGSLSPNTIINLAIIGGLAFAAFKFKTLFDKDSALTKTIDSAFDAAGETLSSVSETIAKATSGFSGTKQERLNKAKAMGWIGDDDRPTAAGFLAVKSGAWAELFPESTPEARLAAALQSS